MARSPSLRPLFGAPFAALAVAGLLAGCGARTEAAPVHLDALADRALTFTLSDVDTLEGTAPAGSHRFTVTFSQGDSCVRLAEGVSATFNGQPMQLSPGGASDTAGRDVCEPPRAWLDFDPDAWASQPSEDARLILQDDSHTVLLVVRDGKARRRFVLQDDSTPDTLRRGQLLTWLWQPATDTLLGPAEVTLFRSGGTSTANLAVQQEGPASRFTIPDATPTESFVLRLSASASGSVLSCEGLASCQGALFHSEERLVTVQP